MNIKAEILKERSTFQTKRIAKYIEENPEKLRELLDLFLSENNRINQRSSTILNVVATEKSSLLIPYYEEIFEHLRKTEHDAGIRNTLRLLQFIDISEEWQGIIVEVCFKYLEATKTPVAIQVFAMTILGNIADKEPGLGQELLLILEDKMDYSSAGFRSRATKIIKKLRKRVGS